MDPTADGYWTRTRRAQGTNSQEWLRAEQGYTPLQGFYIPAKSFAVFSGSSAFQEGGLMPAYWEFVDASSSEVAAVVGEMPDEWEQVDISFYWFNSGTGSGDVRLQAATVAGYSTGADLSVDGSRDHSENVAADAQNILNVTTLTGVTVESGSHRVVRARRVGGAAADTLANSIGLIAVEVAPVA